jgi:hypothetical protein
MVVAEGPTRWASAAASTRWGAGRGERDGRAVRGRGRRGLPRVARGKRTVGHLRHRSRRRLRHPGQRTLALSYHAFTIVRDRFPAKGMHNSGQGLPPWASKGRGKWRHQGAGMTHAPGERGGAPATPIRPWWRNTASSSAWWRKWPFPEWGTNRVHPCRVGCGGEPGGPPEHFRRAGRVPGPYSTSISSRPDAAGMPVAWRSRT